MYVHMSTSPPHMYLFIYSMCRSVYTCVDTHRTVSFRSICVHIYFYVSIHSYNY